MRMMFAALVLAMAMATPALAAHERLFDVCDEAHQFNNSDCAPPGAHVWINVTYISHLDILRQGDGTYLARINSLQGGPAQIFWTFGVFSFQEDAQTVFDRWRARIEDAR